MALTDASPAADYLLLGEGTVTDTTLTAPGEQHTLIRTGAKLGVILQIQSEGSSAFTFKINEPDGQGMGAVAPGGSQVLQFVLESSKSVSYYLNAVGRVARFKWKAWAKLL